MKRHTYFDHTADNADRTNRTNQTKKTDKIDNTDKNGPIEDIGAMLAEACRQRESMYESRNKGDLKGLYESSIRCNKYCRAVLGRLGENEDIFSSTEKMLKEAALNEALVYYRLERFTEALDCLDMAGEPMDDPIYRVMYGSCLFEIGRYKEAWSLLLALEEEGWTEDMDIYGEGITAYGCLQLSIMIRMADRDNFRARDILNRWMDKFRDEGIRKLMRSELMKYRGGADGNIRYIE